MVFRRCSHRATLALAVSGTLLAGSLIAVTGPGSRVFAAGAETGPSPDTLPAPLSASTGEAVPASDAAAPSSALTDTRTPDPVAADALKIEGRTAETPAVAPPASALPATAKAYASADPEAGIAFPLPDAAVSPVAPVPDVPDPRRAVLVAPDIDLPALRAAIDTYRKGKVAEGDRLREAFSDPAARALLEWVAIRAGAGIGFERTVAFTRSYPDWPAGPLLRRRAEEALLIERKSPAIVRAYFATTKPASPPGKFALALAFRSEGLDGDAAALVRDLWRSDTFGRGLETRVMDAFPGVLTRIDHRFRMERALLKEDYDTAGRAASYAGASYATLVRARRAVEDKSASAPAALNAVPPSLRGDSSYILSRAQYLRRTDRYAEAAALLSVAPTNPDVLVDGDEWWVERRIVARKLVDLGDARTAYVVAGRHSARTVEKRIEAEFHAGWIALRFLDDAGTAARHFEAAAAIAETPISLARAAYWQGRAAEALGKTEDAKAAYERAALQPIAYYGQLARAKLGRASLALRALPELDAPARAAFMERLPMRALRLLEAASLRDLALPLYIDAATKLADPAELDALGTIATEVRNARALVAIGKIAVQRGLPLDLHAYPTIGIPAYEASAAVPLVEKAMVFAIARQESQFDPLAQSSVGARGLMQMMPATAQRTARRVSAAFDQDRLTSDPAYNARLGQAHLGELMDDWRGSYILAFASYNAGGGNVKKWIDAYGDPRKPGVDPIDWVERIPFTETRNYVQRVMENLQIYRTRLDTKSALLIEGDLQRGAR